MSDISSLYYWEPENTLWCISSGLVYSVDVGGTFVIKGTGLDLHNRASWSVAKIAGKNFLAFANGGRIYYSINGGGINPIADENAPANVTSLDFVNNRLVANDSRTDIFYFSNLNDPLTWDPLNYASAEGSPDVINKLVQFQSDILIWGTKSLERWYLTGDSLAPFARRPGSVQNIGTLSPNSIVYDEEINSFLFINHNRSVIIYDGAGYKKISEPIDKILYDLQDLSSITGDIIKINDKKFYILSCPGVNDLKVMVYDLNAGFWYQWGSFNGITGQYELLPWQVCQYVAEWGKNVGGSRTESKIYDLNPQIYTDNGDPIYSSIMTGFIHCGTETSKTFQELNLRVKQDPGKNSKYIIAYRKDSEGIFDPTKVRTLNVGSGSLTSFHQSVYSFGTAKAIQFKISCTDDSKFIIGESQLTYTVNRS